MKKVAIGCGIATGVGCFLLIILIVVIAALALIFSGPANVSTSVNLPGYKQKKEISFLKNNKQPKTVKKTISTQEAEVINLAKEFITSIDNKEYAYIYNNMLVAEFREQYSYEKIKQLLSQFEKLEGLMSIDSDNAIVKIEEGINTTSAEISINAKYAAVSEKFTIKAIKNDGSYKIMYFKYEPVKEAPKPQPSVSGLNFNVPLPGNTLGDKKLQYDTLSTVYIVAGAKVKGCENMSVINTKVTKSLSGVKYKGTKPIAGNWEEVWTVDACSQKIDIPIKFSLDETGASYSVTAR